MKDNVIDTAAFDELKATAGADFVAELAATFFEEAPLMLGELRHAQTAADTERYRRAAHSLKSNSQTFGALRLAELARVQELAGLPADATPIDALQAEFDTAAAALRELIDG